MDPKKMDMIKYAVAIIIIIVGLVILLHGLYQKWKVNQIAAWPTTRVEVLSVTILPANSAAGATVLYLEDLPPSIEDKGMYTPMVSYRYKVGGRTYNSDGLMYNQDSSYTSLEVRTLLDPLNNRIVTAYYNPSDPKEAYLYPSESSWVYPIFGAILMVIGGAIATYVGYSASKRNTVYSKVVSIYDRGMTSAYDANKGFTEYLARGNYVN